MTCRKDSTEPICLTHSAHFENDGDAMCWEPRAIAAEYALQRVREALDGAR